jgi:hypothetical protein
MKYADSTQKVWVGTYGTYPIPESMQDIRICKNGWPDQRQKRLTEILHWVDEQEKKAKADLGGVA